MLQPPVWISQESWEAFHEMRRRIKAPLTPYAEKLILAELVKLKAAREDPQACLDQSIANSWRDVFRLRDKGLSDARIPDAAVIDGPMTAQERAAADKARGMAMAAIKISAKR